MPQSWRVYLAVIGVAVFWLGIAFVVLPRLGDPVSFNKMSSTTVPAMTETDNAAPLRSFRGNVYHIILDSYQSEAYQYFLEKTPELNQLPFTYYPNFRTNSSLTYYSMPELFTGNYFTPGTLPENWHNAAFQGQGMLGYLAAAGIRLHSYTYHGEYCYRGAATAACRVTEELKRGELGEGRAYQTAFDLWFLKLIPGSLKRELNARFTPEGAGTVSDMSDDDSFSDWDYGFSLLNAIKPSGEPRDGDNPYFSVQEFKRFLEDEDARPATGQYIFLHVILPHGPLVLDGECNYIGELTKAQRTAQTEQERYLGQVQCAHKLMGLLAKKLESLGRLDNSLIIAQADHGHYMHPADLGVLYKFKPLDVTALRIDHDKADSSTWSSEMIEVKSSALLLIKLPGQSSASRSDKPVQMIDIAPTILRYFGIETPASMRGIPIQDMPESPARDRFFFATNRIPERTHPKVMSEYRYVDGRWKFTEDIAIPTNADQLFLLGATP